MAQMTYKSYINAMIDNILNAKSATELDVILMKSQNLSNQEIVNMLARQESGYNANLIQSMKNNNFLSKDFGTKNSDGKYKISETDLNNLRKFDVINGVIVEKPNHSDYTTTLIKNLDMPIRPKVNVSHTNIITEKSTPGEILAKVKELSKEITSNIGNSFSNIEKAIKEVSAKYLGVKYVWGAKDPKKGLDCSGFITQVFKDLGVSCPHGSMNQFHSGPGRVVYKNGQGKLDISSLQVGDIIYFDTKRDNNDVNHVGIYIGNGKMRHASFGHKKVVDVELARFPFLHNVTGVKRVIDDPKLAKAVENRNSKTLTNIHSEYVKGTVMTPNMIVSARGNNKISSNSKAATVIIKPSNNKGNVLAKTNRFGNKAITLD